MLKKFLISRFNKKYAGKELLFCDKIFEDLLFWPFTVHKCCHCTKMPYAPPLIFKKIPEKFNFYHYIKRLEQIISLNQTPTGECSGCKFLKKQIIPELKTKEIFKFITINHFTKCNSNCIYCGIDYKKLDVKYSIVPILQDIIKQNLIHKDVLFNWGGGEPTLCKEFESIANLLNRHNYRQAINSSGIIFSETILNGLKDGSISIQISPDSGTEETYFKIKRQNNFNKVWENIKLYAQYPDMLFVKYIFFSVSANENDIRKFIEKCKNTNVKNIVIDCESRSENAAFSPFGKINKSILDLAVLMKHLAVENNINYQISYQWTDEHKKYIEEN